MKGLGLVAVLALAGCFHEISPLVDPNATDEVTFQKARAAYDAMHFDEAAALFDDFVIAFPDSVRHAEAWYMAGRSRYELGSFEDAIRVLVEMREANPTSRFVMNASYYVGRSEYEVQRYGEAELELAAFETMYPDTEYLDDARFYLGRTFYDRALWVDAIAPFDRVIEMDSEGFLVDASFYVGRARYETGDVLGALPDFRRVVALDPFGMFGDNSQYYVGRCLFDAGDLVDAVPELAVAETNYPDSEYMDSIRYYLGRSFYDRALYGDAVGPFERLIEIAATTLRDDGLFLLGRSRYEVGDLDTSLPPMQEIESAYPASNFVDNSLYWQARIYTDRTDCASAQAAVTRMQAAFPTSTELPRAQTYLAGHGC